MNQIIIDEDVENIIKTDLPWEKFRGTTILITGAFGMLPAYMVETLVRLNRDGLDIHIVAQGRLIYKHAYHRFFDYQRENKLFLLPYDICQPISIYSGGADYIVHAASIASPKYYEAEPVQCIAPNVLGTYHLLEFARTRNTKGFLYFSSGDAALWWDTKHVRACYGESKKMGEVICEAFLRQYNVPAYIARISHTYGPGFKLGDGRVFSDFVEDILAHKKIVPRGDGAAERPFLYIADATIAFFTILLKGLPGEIYNVAGSEWISIRELADRLNGQSAEEFHQLFDISKMQELGWNPTTSVESGFDRTVKYYE